MPQLIRERLQAGEVLFGPWCVVPSDYMMNVTASAGFDFVMVDLEHGPFTFDTAERMIRAAQAESVSAITRLGQISEEQILKSLDAGADGVLTAHVESAADAARVISYTKYYPDGGRGFSPFTRAGGYSGGDITRHSEVQNQRTVTGVILEGKQGIASLEEVLATEHLNLIYIGAYDLSQALGMPGQVNHPEIRREMERCIRTIRDAGVAAGGFVARTRDDMQWMMDIGMQFITYLPDCTVFHNAMRDAVETFHQVRSGKEG